MKCGSSRFEIKNKNEKQGNDTEELDYKLTDLLVTCKEGKEKGERRISLLHYTAWPEDGHPPESILRFIEEVWAQQAAMETMRSSHQGYATPPIIVHCSSGGRRAGVFAALSSCCKDLCSSGRVDVKATVTQIRKERYGCLQETSQYILIYKYLAYFAVKKNQVPSPEPCVKKFIEGLKKEAEDAANKSGLSGKH